MVVVSCGCRILPRARWRAIEIRRSGFEIYLAGAASEGVDEMIYVASLVASIRASANQTHASGAQSDRSWCAM
ncbi:hypothetical protein, partial [Ramlibacter sp. 2FC]|uniref:hypothetical protein n=1 Tax=Ramlibacter sp. 2FC TaxID=2502188 RepID=UPI001BB16887